MKKTITFTLAVLMMVTFVGCTSKSSDTTKDKVTPPSNAIGENSGSASIPNPFTDCATLAEAEKIAGFSLALPKSLINDSVKVSYRAQKGTMIEVIISKEEEILRIRKAKGDGDISGDYNEYSQINTVYLNGKKITLKGNDGNINVAIWTNEGYSYGLLINNKINEEDTLNIISEIN